MEALFEQDARAAFAAAWSFWKALGDDDDQRVLAALTPAARGVFGTAAEVRASLGIESATIGMLGTWSSAEVFADGTFRFRFAPTGAISRQVRAGEELLAWLLDVEPHAGHWLVNPTRHDHGDAIGSVELVAAERPPARA
jgi:hypothetical protein